MSDQQVTMKVGGQDVVLNLAQLAGIDTSDIDAYQGGPCPAGMFHWRVKECMIDTREFNEADGKTLRAYIHIGLESTNCIALADKTLSPNDYIGVEHREWFTIRDVEKDVGRFIFLCQQVGFNFRGPLPEMCNAFVGHQFQGPITNRKDKNDPDRVYADLVAKQCTPLSESAPMMQAVATGSVQAAPPVQPAPAAQPTTAFTGLPGAGS